MLSHSAIVLLQRSLSSSTDCCWPSCNRYGHVCCHRRMILVVFIWRRHDDGSTWRLRFGCTPGIRTWLLESCSNMRHSSDDLCCDLCSVDFSWVLHWTACLASFTGCLSSSVLEDACCCRRSMSDATVVAVVSLRITLRWLEALLLAPFLCLLDQVVLTTNVLRLLKAVLLTPFMYLFDQVVFTTNVLRLLKAVLLTPFLYLFDQVVLTTDVCWRHSCWLLYFDGLQSRWLLCFGRHSCIRWRHSGTHSCWLR